MVVTESYHRAQARVPANIIGFPYDTFNERGTEEAYNDATLKWSSAQDIRIPAVGTAYTREGFDWSKAAFLN